MPWPQLTDYQEAIQHPDRCFDDAELRQGALLLDALGLPKPVTGGFASVYQLVHGHRRYAVRCFSRPVPDIEQRYARISGHLRRVRLPAMVLFEFLPRGIRVRGQWYPVVKMEWVDGDPLHVYLERHLADVAAIRALAGTFARLCADLKHRGIAHGDLQHGNILVVDGELRLIDYDGMYVPDLAGLPSHELGHRNYQHPRRTEREFGPHLDHFSAWVIYASLMALSVEPALWQRVGGGDECLLFRREDFDRPDASLALAALARQRDGRVQALAAALRSAMSTPDLARLPALDQLIGPAAPAPAPLPDWVEEHVAGAATAPRAGNGQAAPAPAWVLDHLQTAAPVRLSTPVVQERAVLATVLLAGMLLAYGGHAGALPLGVTAGALAGSVVFVLTALAWHYHRRAEVSRQTRLRAARRRSRRAIRRDERYLARGRATATWLDEDEARALARLAPRQQLSAAREQAELTGIDQRLTTAVARLDEKRQSLLLAEADELARRLRRLQERFLQQQLAQHWVMGAHIEGIGAALKARLLLAGVRTAADIARVRFQASSQTVEIVLTGYGSVHVEGIGPVRAAHLAAWRRQLEDTYRGRLPASLPPEEETAVRARYLAQQTALHRQTTTARQAAQRRADDVRHAFGQEQTRLEQQARAIRERHGARRDHNEQEMAATRARLAESQWRLATVQQELAAYDRVTVAAYLRQLLFLPERV